MGIDAETARRVLEIIKADAASRPSGKVRTKDVIAAVEALGLKVRVTPAAVIILAGSLGLLTERGAEAGKGGGGRPRGARDRRPRQPRADRPSQREEVQRLRKEHPEWSMDAIGLELGITRQAVFYHLKDKISTSDSDG